MGASPKKSPKKGASPKKASSPKASPKASSPKASPKAKSPKKAASTSPKKAGKKAAKGDKKEKKPLKGYMKFMQEQRPVILKKHPNFSFGEVGKEAGKLWGALSAAEKAKYN